MPPKPKFSREEIIDIAFEFVRENGWEGLSARYIAKQLNSSTMPIYSIFGSMQEIEKEIVRKALDLFYEHCVLEKTGDPWEDSGIGYIQFAKKEKHLFRSINDEKHAPMRREIGLEYWSTLAESLSDYGPFKGLSREQVENIRIARWFLVHGMASLVNTASTTFQSEEEFTKAIQLCSRALITGFKKEFEEDPGFSFRPERTD